MPLLPSGSVANTTKYRAAEVLGDGEGDARIGRLLARAEHGGHARLRADGLASRLVSLRPLRPDARASAASTSVGERMPWAKPAAAASPAAWASLDGGSPLMKSRPRPIQRRPEAASDEDGDADDDGTERRRPVRGEVARSAPLAGEPAGPGVRALPASARRPRGQNSAPAEGRHQPRGPR